MSPQGGKTFSCLLDAGFSVFKDLSQSILRGIHRREGGQRDRAPLLRRPEGHPSDMPLSLPQGLPQHLTVKTIPTERSTWSREFLNCCSPLRGFF